PRHQRESVVSSRWAQASCGPRHHNLRRANRRASVRRHHRGLDGVGVLRAARRHPQRRSSIMTVPLFHVDAFTDRPFAGNPAAVCLLPSWKEDRWLQAVAREMTLSETAFLVRQPDHFDLRWFTPKVEVDLCGHATLASAHVLW